MAPDSHSSITSIKGPLLLFFIKNIYFKKPDAFHFKSNDTQISLISWGWYTLV